MNDKTKQSVANRTAYIILALLLVAVLTVTVVAIAATVSKRNEKLPEDELPSDGGTENETPDEGSAGEVNPPPADDEANGENEPPADNPPEQDTPSDTQPEAQVFVLPANGYVTKSYTEDVLVFSPTMNDYRVHKGVDISGNLGDSVYAFAEGTITSISNDPFMGKTVVITHENGIESKYMNLADQLAEGITVGATVETGAVIGAIGESAISECADEPHLHFEVFLNGDAVDPSNYVTFNKE